MQEMGPDLTKVLYGLVGTGAGLLISLYVKESSRKVVEEALIKMQIEMHKEIAAALQTFKIDFLETMDKTYKRAAECDLLMEYQADRIDMNVKQLDSMHESIRSMKKARPQQE